MNLITPHHFYALIRKIMPSVIGLLLDPFGPVRDAAFDCIGSLLEPVRDASNALKREEEALRKKQVAEESLRPKVGEIQKVLSFLFCS